MSTTLSIRPAEAEDLFTIGFLAQQIWPSTYRDILKQDQLDYMMNLFYSPESMKRQLVEEGHLFLIAEDEEEPVGFADYSLIAEPGVYKLNKIYVLPELQGKGVGKAMLDFILGEIKSLDATELQLNVNRHNKARVFYERMGFNVIREEDIDIGRGYFMNDYVMSKII